MSERPPRIPDEELVRGEIGDAALEEREISDAAARVIASWWHSGQGSAFYSFASTGAIDKSRLIVEWQQAHNHTDVSDFDQLALDYFSAYIDRAPGTDDGGNRGPVDGWADLTRWDESS